MEVLPFTPEAGFQMAIVLIFAVAGFLASPAGRISDRDRAWYVFVIYVLFGLWHVASPDKTFNMAGHVLSPMLIALMLHVWSRVAARRAQRHPVRY